MNACRFLRRWNFPSERQTRLPVTPYANSSSAKEHRPSVTGTAAGAFGGSELHAAARPSYTRRARASGESAFEADGDRHGVRRAVSEEDDDAVASRERDHRDRLAFELYAGGHVAVVPLQRKLARDSSRREQPQLRKPCDDPCERACRRPGRCAPPARTIPAEGSARCGNRRATERDRTRPRRPPTGSAERTTARASSRGWRASRRAAIPRTGQARCSWRADRARSARSVVESASAITSGSNFAAPKANQNVTATHTPPSRPEARVGPYSGASREIGAQTGSRPEVGPAQSRDDACARRVVADAADQREDEIGRDLAAGPVVDVDRQQIQAVRGVTQVPFDRFAQRRRFALPALPPRRRVRDRARARRACAARRTSRC